MLTRVLFKGIFKFSSPQPTLFLKVPKAIKAEQSSGNFFTKFFSLTKTYHQYLHYYIHSSPSYLLLKELFHYLQTTSMLQEEFPFINNDERFKENWMLMHAILLKQRFVQEKEFQQTISQVQIEKYDYNLQTYFFLDYCQTLYPHIPVKDFARHYIEAYTKKFKLFEEQDLENEKRFQSSMNGNQQTDVKLHYGQLLKQIIFENRVKNEDLELVKLCKYYAAHKRYLSSLEWDDMLQYKVKWGFQGDIKLIQKF